MDAPTTVTRTIDTELTADELWSLIAEGDRWPEWMVDEAEVAVEPGAAGRVAEGGVERDVAIREVAPGHHVSFEWWPSGEPELASAVDLHVLPAVHGSVLHVVESFPSVSASAQASAAAWTARESRLQACWRTRLLIAA